MTDTFDISSKIQQVETHLQILYGDMASYLKTIEKMKQKCNRLSTHVKDYSVVETPGLKQSFASFSDCLTQVEDRRKEMYDRLQIKVYEGMKNYETACKDIKESMKLCGEAEQAQSKKQKELAVMNAKNKSGEISKITTARQALAKASSDTKSAKEKFHKELENFEKQKIRDFKAIWSEYIHTHLMYHSKALEIFTRAHLIINDVDEDEEMETILRYTRARAGQDDMLAEDENAMPLSSRPATPSSPLNQSLNQSQSSLNQSQSLNLNQSQQLPSGRNRSLSSSVASAPLHHSTTSLPRHNSSYHSPPNHSMSTSSLPVHASPGHHSHHSYSTSSLPVHSMPGHSPHSPAPIRRSTLSASSDAPLSRDRGMSSSQKESDNMEDSSGSIKRNSTNSNLRSSRTTVPIVEDDEDFDD